MRHWKQLNDYDGNHKEFRTEEGFHAHNSRGDIRSPVLYLIALVLLITQTTLLTGVGTDAVKNLTKALIQQTTSAVADVSIGLKHWLRDQRESVVSPPTPSLASSSRHAQIQPPSKLWSGIPGKTLRIEPSDRRR